MPDPRPDPHGHLDRLAARVADDPYFLAYSLALYQRLHALSDFALAAELHCDPSMLTPIRLCRAPRPGWKFAGDVAEVCVRFGCDRAALRKALEEASGPAPSAQD
jgi:hypothetical protein